MTLIVVMRYRKTLLKAYEKLPTLKREKFFRTWITRILINECKGILRRRKNVIPYEDYMDNARMFEENRYDHLYMAIMELPEDLRILVTLYYIEGFFRKKRLVKFWRSRQERSKANFPGQEIL